MKSLKIVGAAASASLILTTLFGVAPASAAVTELPANANGTDNTGIRTFACEDRVIVSFPMGADGDSGLPFVSKYWDNTTWVTSSGETKYFDTDSGKQMRKQTVFPYETKQPGDTVEIEFTSQGSGDDQTTPFTVEATVVEDDNFAGGSGTSSDPYLISNVNQLDLMRCHDNKHFKLTKNLDMSGRTWLPIGQEVFTDIYPEYRHEWAGELDGAGYTISNLTIENEYQDHVGLFGFVNYSSIKNLKIRNFKVAGHAKIGALFGSSRYSSYSNITVVNTEAKGRDDVGLFAGNSDYRSSFSNISVTGSVVGSPYVSLHPEYDYIDAEDVSGLGGVIGFDDADGSNWDNIKADTNISVYVAPEVENLLNEYSYNDIDFNFIGGIAGESGEGASWSRINNKVSVDIEANIAYGVYRLGGLFGDNEESFANNIITDATFNIRGNANIRSVGGLSGDTESFTASDINSTVVMNLEAGFSGGQSTNTIGGFVGEAYDSGFHDIKSKSKIKLVVVEDAELDSDIRIAQIGGFIGDDEEDNVARIQSDATVSIVPGNGSNNSLEADVEIENMRIEAIGGFVGDRDDYTNYSAISSNAKVNVTTPGAKYVGGFIGDNNEYRTIVLRNVIATGSVSLADSVVDSGALFGRTGAFHLSNVISSIALNPNGATEGIGYLYGSSYDYEYGDEYDQTVDEEWVLAHSRYNKAFFNNQLAGAEAQAGTNVKGRKASVLKSSAFLKANGFDLENVYDHAEGKFPVVKISAPLSAGLEVKTGQSNNDTSISFGLRLADGSRNYFVNLRNEYAREVATLQVVRAGKVVKTINSQATNGVGNWFVNSKFSIKTGDVLRVLVDGKKVSTLTVK